MSGKQLQTTGPDLPQVTPEIVNDFLNMTGHKVPQEKQASFLQIAQAYNLNPFLRELYLLPFKNKSGQTDYNIVVAFAAYLKRAEMSGLLDGWESGTEGSGDNMVGYVQIKRKDWSKEYRHTVRLNEYRQNNQMWKTKPGTMIEKVAISQGFRRCFSVDLAGIPYTDDEIQETVVVEPENTNPSPGKGLQEYLTQMNSIDNFPHLSNWKRKHIADIRRDLDDGERQVLNERYEILAHEFKAEFARQQREKEGATDEPFVCPIDEKPRTFDACDGMTCREHCEHFNK